MFFSSKLDGGVAFVDWAMSGWCNGLNDYCYFMARSMSVKQRRKWEKPLLKLYHRTLVEHGVKNYSFDMCEQHSRLYRLCPLLMIFVVLKSLASDIEGKKGWWDPEPTKENIKKYYEATRNCNQGNGIHKTRN